ncbi:hypothetical protein SAY86_019397 [Trapa natans]|uniref:Protein LNK1 n=1 Tax=Trapa natans TaxID=22666 RepID=A0AAN7LXB4_TRANT|nr:hypothetical protein SAY86_019397 [Trapa natans]
MSDLCIYELQDNVWDEFGESGDHTVPQPPDESGLQKESHKKLKPEISGISINSNCTTSFVATGKRKECPLTFTKRDKMLENGSWSQADDGGFPSSYDGDSVKETGTMTCDDFRTSDHCFKSGTTSELCTKDAVFDRRLAPVDNTLYNYSLNHTSQTEGSLNFFGNEEKEDNDLYYEWPEIGNFEDVDKMFRSCDSTFGLGSLGNDDDFGWFFPSHGIEGSEDALKSGFEFSCPEPTELRNVTANHMEFEPDSLDLTVNDSKARSVPVSENTRSNITCACEAATFDHLQFVNELDMKFKSKGDSTPKEEMTLGRKQLKLHHPSDGKRKYRSLENGDCSQHYSMSKHTMDAKAPSYNKVHQVISPSDPQKNKHEGRSDIFASEQMHDYTSADYHPQVGQESEYPTSSSIKCENNGQPFSSTKESSYASNQILPNHHSLKVHIASEADRASFHKNQHLHGHKFGFLNGSSSTIIYDPVAVLKQVHQTGNDIDGHSEVDGIGIGVKKELASPLPQDSSVSSMLDEKSMEATSFRQLQQVVEKLDIKTKLCIRDSLYRLARSAEQRHSCANPNVVSSGAVTAEESNKCNEFLDMETVTNPIDRSVAHLLFHRPSYPQLVPSSNDVSSPKSNAMINGSVTSTPPAVNERGNCTEEGSEDPEKMAS